uniref:Uncharacterized protein n=1 Tax=Arundo donax TaxID=35708 RepID=A0A0A9HQP2_ARUDO
MISESATNTIKHPVPACCVPSSTWMVNIVFKGSDVNEYRFVFILLTLNDLSFAVEKNTILTICCAIISNEPRAYMLRNLLLAYLKHLGFYLTRMCCCCTFTP